MTNKALKTLMRSFLESYILVDHEGAFLIVEGVTTIRVDDFAAIAVEKLVLECGAILDNVGE